AFVLAVFFFFQAEDGIRDFHVTGVQTCALPILFIDVDTGLRRMGLAPGMPTVELAERIARVPGLEVVGLMSHAGHVSAARTPEEIGRASCRERVSSSVVSGSIGAAQQQSQCSVE